MRRKILYLHMHSLSYVSLFSNCEQKQYNTHECNHLNTINIYVMRINITFLIVMALSHNRLYLYLRLEKSSHQVNRSSLVN